MKKIILAVTGASGSIYAKVLIEQLLHYKEQYKELVLVMSDNAKQIWIDEIGEDSFLNFDLKIFKQNDFNAPFASGSSDFSDMIIVPCSAGTMGRIANGISENLISRAADVMLKERRNLILVLREAPYNLIHIENMKKITLAGGIICPANPSFYHRPKTIDELAKTIIDRVLDLIGLNIETKRWQS